MSYRLPWVPRDANINQNKAARYCARTRRTKPPPVAIDRHQRATFHLQIPRICPALAASHCSLWYRPVGPTVDLAVVSTAGGPIHRRLD